MKNGPCVMLKIVIWSKKVWTRTTVHLTEKLIMGNADFVCEKEGRFSSNVHRLSGVKQIDCKESISTSEDRWPLRSTTRCILVLQD